MKWLIASDLHGSASCVRLLTEAYAREGADRLLLLGDILQFLYLFLDLFGYLIYH